MSETQDKCVSYVKYFLRLISALIHFLSGIIFGIISRSYFSLLYGVINDYIVSVILATKQKVFCLGIWIKAD